MTEVIKNLTNEKARIEADITKLKAQIFDLTAQSKKLDKAIKALTPNDRS